MVPAPRGDSGATDADDVTALPPGTRIGSCEIVAVQARSSLDITYRARDTQADRDVVVKEYLPVALATRPSALQVLRRAGRAAQDFKRGCDRFLAEARTLAQLKDVAGIVTVYDALEDNDTAYMATAPTPGETLAARLQRDRRLSRLAIDRIVAPLLDGLERAHASGCLHLDIRPANILIDRTDRPTLIDFAAWRVGLHTGALETPSGYAPPELSTSAQQGPWTDVYALGATLYHCVTGEPPPTAVERLTQDTLEPAMQAAVGHYAPALLAFIDAALRLKETERPQSIVDWRRMLLVVPTPSAPLRSAGRTRGRADASRRPPPQRRMSLAVGLLVLSLISGVAYLWYRTEGETARQAAAEKAAADAEAKRSADEKAAQEAAETARRAAAAWREIETSEDPAQLRAFAARFPGTAEARQAQQRADQLDAAAKRRTEEEAARRAAEAAKEKARLAAAGWTEVQGSEDPARLRAFAERFAGTPEAQQAIARADQLEATAKRKDEEEAKRRVAEAAREKARAATAQWADLQNSDDVARLRQFADDFAGTPEGRLALNRADELKAAQEQARSRSQKAPERTPGTRETTTTYPDGSRYVGSLANGKRNGVGVYTYANGDTYTGMWLNDDMHGRGIYNFADGGRYEGEWRDDKMHGYGSRTWPDGDRYHGEWRAGKKHGRGTYTFNSGDRYVGDWVDDAMQGNGVYTWKDGGRYEGAWHDDKQNGHGVRVFSDGVRYEGDWKDDQAHGQGTRRDPDGDVFTGRWQNGCFMDGDRAVSVGADLEDCKR